MQIIAADIGGTYSRLAWVKQESSDSGSPQKLIRIYANNGFDSFSNVVKQFIEDCSLEPPALSQVVLALPAPVQSKIVRLTNIDWTINQNDLEKLFPNAQVQLINDFQAAAVGAIRQPAENLVNLNTKASNQTGPILVTGAGTGLGLAWFSDCNQDALPHPTEGGHADFAPTDLRQLDLLETLMAKYGHVSYERLLSGDGLVGIYEFLGGGAKNADAAIVKNLADKNDRSAVNAIRLFVKVFGAYVGNLALLFNPTGGIYICGGMAARLKDWFDHENFYEPFQYKGRMRHMAERIPVYLVTEQDAGLDGSIHIAFKSHGK